MTNLKRQTPRQTRDFTYMSDVMRRLEWDLHNTIELTDRIPAEWHEIAIATPGSKPEKVNLRIETEVMKFFRSMGSGHGARINAVLKSYMHARLAGVIKGAETLAHYRRREELHEGAKPAFGETARSLGQAWEDEGPAPEAKTRARMAEILQQRHAEEGMKGEPEGWFRVR